MIDEMRMKKKLICMSLTLSQLAIYLTGDGIPAEKLHLHRENYFSKMKNSHAKSATVFYFVKKNSLCEHGRNVVFNRNSVLQASKYFHVTLP